MNMIVSDCIYKLREEATKDPDYQQLHHIINHGFLDYRSQLVEACRCFWNVREHLTIVDGLIMYGCRSLRPMVLVNLTSRLRTK